MLATGSDNGPAVWVSTTEISCFGSGPVQKPNPVLFGGPNQDPYPSTCRFCLDWLDPSVLIAGFVFRVSQSLVAFRYATAYRTILTSVCQYLFWMHMPPSRSKQTEIHSLPQLENEWQWSVNDCWPCIMAKHSTKWLILFTYIILTVLIC